MFGYTVGLIGVVILWDGLYSITLYLNAPSYAKGRKQSWRRDHWVRLVRMLLGITLVVIGAMTT